MDCGIYVITNVINHKVYVGSSKTLNRRKHHHFYQLRRNEHCNAHLQRAYNCYGRQAFHWEILEYCDTELLQERETWWMDLLDSRNKERGYNLWSANRREMSEETRAKISTALTGKPLSEDHRTKLSVAQTGKKKSKEAIEKAAQYRRGRTRSEETKNKISAAKTGSKHSELTREKISTANTGRAPYNKGTPMPEEQRDKLRLAWVRRKERQEDKLDGIQ